LSLPPTAWQRRGRRRRPRRCAPARALSCPAPVLGSCQSAEYSVPICGMADRDRLRSDGRAVEVLAPLIEACRPPHKTDHHDLRRTSRRSSGGTTMARSGARSRPNSARGGWRRRPSAAGRAGRLGAAGWKRRSGAAGLSRDGVPRRHRIRAHHKPRARPIRGHFSDSANARAGLGRSRGGYGTTACVIADASVAPSASPCAAGHELPLAPLLWRASRSPADRGRPRLRSHALPRLIWRLGARPAIPAKRTAKRPWPVRRDLPKSQRGSSVSGRGSRSGVRCDAHTRDRCSFMGVAAWPHHGLDQVATQNSGY
jgi:hypothetical protein